MDHARALHDRFALLVSEHQGWLRAYVRTLGIAAEAMDDVAQEVFLTAYRRYADYDESRPFAAWLKGIAKLLAANERRRHHTRGRLIEPSLAAALLAVDETESHTGDTEDPLILAAQSLPGCLDQLPDHARELLRLRYEEDLDASVMGERLGRDSNTVRQALFRVREVLRRCLDSHGIGPSLPVATGLLP